MSDFTSLGSRNGTHAGDSLHGALVKGGFYHAGNFASAPFGTQSEVAREIRRRLLQTGVIKEYHLSATVADCQGVLDALRAAGVNLT